MGYGPKINGRHEPITPWAGSWAEQEQRKRAEQGPVRQIPVFPRRPSKGQGSDK